MENIENDVLTIENGVLTKCKEDAVNVVIPEGVTEIGEGVFVKCDSLKSVVFPSSIKLIDDNTFFECNSLSSMVIPEGLSKIGNNAFQNCTALDTIVFDGKLSQWEEEVKKGTDWNKNVPAKVAHCK